MKQFFNTIKETGAELKTLIQKAENQNERIYGLIKYFDKPMTPFDVHKAYKEFFCSVPITSIRRAMSTLTDDGRLIKTENMKVEQYGAKNHLWKVV